MLKRILLNAIPIPKITQFQNYFFVGPHPDDIEVACGATVAKLTKLGKKVTFVVCTDGNVGSLEENLTSQQIVEIRKKEAQKSAQLLGAEVIFLPFADGGDYTVEQLCQHLAKIILQTQPQIVFCPDHTQPCECHPDHLKCGQATTQAIFVCQWQKLTQKLGLDGTAKDVTVAYYYTHKPNRYVGIKKYRKLHRQAIACHTSQFDEVAIKNLYKYFDIRQLRFGLRSAKGRADGYRVLNPTHQHCFPEIGE